jgi:hypothetical protein
MMLIRIIISLALHVTYLKIIFIFKLSKIAWLFFVTGLETLQILGVEMSTTESNVRSFEAFLKIYLSIITRNT